MGRSSTLPGLIVTVLLAACTSVRSVPIAAAPAAEPLAERWRERLPPTLSVEAGKRFVVVGDIASDELEFVTRELLEPASDALEHMYFDRVPRRVVTVWLLDGEASYKSYADTYLNHVSRSTYGYYAPKKRAIVLNYAMGAGTAVHEMVHAYVRASFPRAPSWFDEGLASLYEESELSDEELRGRVNWRLPPLQRALAEGTAPRLRDVMHASRKRFYEEPDQSLHYAVGRYVCFALQEWAMLEPFYRAFREHQGSDPSGIATLEAVSGTSLEEFEREWRSFVAELEYRPEPAQ
jgi:hypothetical protein